MRKSIIIIVTFILTVLITQPFLFAFETAPRISDREIVERLTRLEEGQKTIEMRFDDVNRRIDDLRSEMNSRFEAMDNRFDTLEWMFGLFITIALVILGFVLRMQWQMHRRQTRVETILETHKDELAFLKSFIEKLLPPKGVL